MQELGSLRKMRLMKLIWLAPALVGASLSVWQLSAEAVVSNAMARSAGDVDARGGLDAAFAEAAAETLPPRAMLADSIYFSRVAVGQRDGPVGQRALNSAITGLQRALVGRSLWGDGWANLAYAAALRDGEGAPLALSAYSASYRATPYLRGSAAWRIAYGFGLWEQLSPETRLSLVNEAVWWSRMGEAERDYTLGKVRDSTPDAYMRFMVVWMQSRRGDAGFRLGEGEAP
jgi:hypothetical protein